jgi:uncharacterized phage-associated protein
MASAHDVAKYFLAQADEDEGELISNLKLQKLLYYAQGFHLALQGRPLFGEELAAWEHGPVVPVVYHAYKHHGAGPIPCPDDLDCSRFSEDERTLLDEVYSVYGQFSAWKLRQMTHSESPWLDATKGAVIPHSALTEYFRTQLA